MSKRNFTLLIIVLIIIIIAVFGFLYFNKPSINTNGGTTGTNFFSQFSSSFGNSKKTSTVTTPPVNVSGTTPPIAPVKLIKVSSMPIAGFTVFNKERLIAVPVATTSNTSTNLGPSSTLSTNSGQTTTTTSSTTTPSTSSTTTTPSASSGQASSPAKKTTKKTKVVKPTPPPTEFVPALRYVARSNGNIYETFADKIQETQFSTTVIPQVYDAYFGNGGNSVAMRYLKADGETIETFFSNLPKEIFGATAITNNTIKGSLLPDNTEDINVSPDNSSLFYIFDSGINDMVGTTFNLTTNKKVQIFDSPFTEWTSWWPNKNIITLTTKPAATIPGYMYTMDSSGKNLTQTLGNVNGLTTLMSPSGKLILYGNDGLNLYVYNISTNSSILLGVKTLPEKCTWNGGSDTVYCAVPRSTDTTNQYPDAWYQGEVSFSDQIWKIDVATGNTTMLVDPLTVSGGQDIDGIKLALDPSENYLFFVNKKDSYLWEFNLK